MDVFLAHLPTQVCSLNQTGAKIIITINEGEEYNHHHHHHHSPFSSSISKRRTPSVVFVNSPTNKKGKDIWSTFDQSSLSGGETLPVFVAVGLLYVAYTFGVYIFETRCGMAHVKC
jgi:hypothetical protein